VVPSPQRVVPVRRWGGTQEILPAWRRLLAWQRGPAWGKGPPGDRFSLGDRVLRIHAVDRTRTPPLGGYRPSFATALHNPSKAHRRQQRKQKRRLRKAERASDASPGDAAAPELDDTVDASSDVATPPDHSNDSALVDEDVFTQPLLRFDDKLAFRDMIETPERVPPENSMLSNCLDPYARWVNSIVARLPSIVAATRESQRTPEDRQRTKSSLGAKALLAAPTPGLFPSQRTDPRQSVPAKKPAENRPSAKAPPPQPPRTSAPSTPTPSSPKDRKEGKDPDVKPTKTPTSLMRLPPTFDAKPKPIVKAPPLMPKFSQELMARLAQCHCPPLTQRDQIDRYCYLITALVDEAQGRPMSTSQVRAFLLANPDAHHIPLDVLETLNVDHIIPSYLGGHDHPGNYFLCPSALNSSFGHWVEPIKAEYIGSHVWRQAMRFAAYCREKNATYNNW